MRPAGRFVAKDEEKPLSDHAEPSARALEPGLLGRIGQAVMRPFREIAARLRAALWLIVAVAVIMASLGLIAGLSKTFALIGLVSFVASVLLLPRPDADQALAVALERPSAVARTASAMHVVAAAPERGRAVTVTYSERVPVGRRMAATVAPLTRRSERGGNILVLLRDLTEVERINQMRADFIANASHELRTPLASLRGFIETLQSSAKGDPGARERFLPIMAEQASRMTRLIDALLSLSRVEMNAHVPPSDLVDLNDVLGHVKDTLDPLARDMGFRFDVAHFSRPAIVRGNRDELVQVLQNLVQNAFKYGDRGGQVRIEAKHIPALGRQAGRYAIAIVDTGPGIAPEHLPRLTERFYPVDVASSREKGGTGLGLAIVKHILNRHRGELAIASKPGKGSTFTVMLNEARASHAERGAASG